ncbi:MAG: GspH/FimT family pseudopilin [Phycisphaerae bacterium]|nr:GspH/FimT family pseudopilin [Phycisphaerae bacterium]
MLRFVGSGFTLLELMMGIVIMTIIGIGVIPLMSMGAQSQVYTAADGLAADLNYARNLAITHGQTFRVHFHAWQNTYEVRGVNGAVITHPVTKKAYHIAYAQDKRLSEVDLVEATFDTTHEIRFDYQGSPYDGNGNPLNSGLVTLTAGSETRFVAVEPVTGVISVQY